jgi:hypothetical protein
MSTHVEPRDAQFKSIGFSSERLINDNNGRIPASDMHPCVCPFSVKE